MSHRHDSILQQEPVPAWYKQFWPWFLIILPGIVVVASIITVVIAFQRADTLVADNYYKEGLAINKTVTDLNNAKTLNVHGTMYLDGKMLRLQLDSGSRISDSAIVLELQHPLDKHQDTRITLAQVASGEYTAPLPALAPGKWYASLQSTAAGNPWRISTTVMLPATELVIRPE